MQIAWATDIHLNFVTAIERHQFLESVGEQADALLVTGDMAESNSLGEILQQMSIVLNVPIYCAIGETLTRWTSRRFARSSRSWATRPRRT